MKVKTRQNRAKHGRPKSRKKPRSAMLTLPSNKKRVGKKLIVKTSGLKSRSDCEKMGKKSQSGRKIHPGSQILGLRTLNMAAQKGLWVNFEGWGPVAASTVMNFTGGVILAMLDLGLFVIPPEKK